MELRGVGPVTLPNVTVRNRLSQLTHHVKHGFFEMGNGRHLFLRS
jgi:hypothetical protein